MGWENIFQCEINPFCQRVLKYWFPQCELFSDIKTSDFKKYENRIDIISAGFPCQPFSVAGKRKGTQDDRYIWTEVFRAICEIQPQWIVLENVVGLITQQRGMVFERMCADLEDEEYDVQSFIIPACAVCAPHRRERVFIIANTESFKNIRQGQDRFQSEPSGTDAERVISDTKKIGQQGWKQTGKKRKMEMQSGRFYSSYNRFDEFPTQPPVCRRNDGVSAGLDCITFSSLRRKSIEAFGNAVVPQVIYEIFRAIEKVEQKINNK